MTPLPHTIALLTQGLADGLHLGAQMVVIHRGTTVADVALGDARPGLPMTRDISMLWLSAGKPLTAAAVCQLWERGRLDLHDPVTRYIPEFAAHGKQDNTLFHLLTHTSSIRAGVLPPARSWADLVANVAAMRPEPRWTPGQRAGYSGYNNWTILGEVIRRVDGRPPAAFIRDNLLAPLDMTGTFLALTPDEYPAWAPRLGVMHRTDTSPPKPAETHPADRFIALKLGGSTHGPARDLARFYQMLLNEGQHAGVRVLQPATVRAMTSRHRQGMYDQTFRRALDYGLGLLLNTPESHDPNTPPPPPFGYGYGPHASPDTFGHSGMQSSVGLCDPAHELIIAAIFNGQPGDTAHANRQYTLLKTIYEELGVA